MISLIQKYNVVIQDWEKTYNTKTVLKTAQGQRLKRKNSDELKSDDGNILKSKSHYIT